MKPVAHTEKGAALLAAMVTVALVASLASAALWMQWRQVEIEIAERGRDQTRWMMTGAFDWTRLILSEDARTSSDVDHLGEPWAIPVEESKLSTFLSQDKQWREGDPEVYLSGGITDAQARLNLQSLMSGETLDPFQFDTLSRIFEQLDLPPKELEALVLNWGKTSSNKSTSPLQPQNMDQLAWFGLSPKTIYTLKPYVTILPEATPVNVNTASELVLSALLQGHGLGQEQALLLIKDRLLKPWSNFEATSKILNSANANRLNSKVIDVKSQYFEIRGRLRIDHTVQNEVLLIKREGSQTKVLSRVRATVKSIGTAQS